MLGLGSVWRYPCQSNSDSSLPPLFENPLDALCYQQGGKRVAFHCPLELTVKTTGLSYSRAGWHPRVATLVEYAAGRTKGYSGSILETFYEKYQPSNAAEAIVGFDRVPEAYSSYPSHVFICPWSSLTVDELDRITRRWVRSDREEHGGNCSWSIETDGYPVYGPVSERAGRLEYQRLIDVYERLKSDGYDRSHGHIHFLILRRGEEYRFLNKGPGQHRAAAMAVLGHETVPAVFKENHVIDLRMAEYWPQVQNGAWTRGQVEAYFDHLFDFGSQSWARRQELISE